MSEARLIACREKALGILAVIFVAGLATGILGTRGYDRYVEKKTANPLEQQSAVAIERLRRDLSLDEEQANKVRTILDEYIMMEADLLSQVHTLQQQGRSSEQNDPQQRLASPHMRLPRPVRTQNTRTRAGAKAGKRSGRWGMWRVHVGWR